MHPARPSCRAIEIISVRKISQALKQPICWRHTERFPIFAGKCTICLTDGLRDQGALKIVELKPET